MRLVIFILLAFVSWSCKKTLKDVQVRSLSSSEYVQKDFSLVPEYSPTTTINAFDNKKFSENGFFVGANYLNLCVNFTKLVSGPKDVKVKYQVDNGISISSSGTLTDTQNNFNVCMKDDWDYKFQLANSAVDESHIISMELFVVKDGKDISLKKFSWNIDVLANNTTPSISNIDVNGNGNFIPANTTRWINISGSGFLPSPNFVKVNGTSCNQINYISLTEIDCEVSAIAAGAYDVYIENSNALSDTAVGINGLNVLAPFTTTNNTEYAGITGTNTLTIDGANFHQNVKVEIGGTTCNNISVTSPNANGISNQITCDIPIMGQGTYVVQITNPDQFSYASIYDLNLNPAPAIKYTNKSEVMLAAGTVIDITTDFLQNTPSLPTVDVYNGSSTFSCTNVSMPDSNTVRCETPAMAAGTYDIIVTNHDGQSDTLINGITYNPLPTISSIQNPDGASASSTSGGYYLNIVGTGFRPGVTMSIGGIACVSLAYNSDTSLLCESPAIATSGTNQTVLITNPDTQSITDSVYYGNPPTLTMAIDVPDPFFNQSDQSFNITITTSSASSDLELADIDQSSNIANASFTGGGTTYTYSADGNISGSINTSISNFKFSDAYGIYNETGASLSFEYITPADLKATNIGWKESSPLSGELNAEAVFQGASSETYLNNYFITFYSDNTCTTSIQAATDIQKKHRYDLQVYEPDSWYYKITSVQVDGNYSQKYFYSQCSSLMQFQGTISALIKPTCGSEPTVCFTSLANWNTNILTHPSLSSKDLVNQGYKLITYIDGSWTSGGESGAVAISGWTTSANNNLVFETRGEARHNGHPYSAAYRLETAATNYSVLSIGDATGSDSSDTAYTVIDGVILEGASGSGIAGLKVFAANTNLKNSIIKDINASDNDGHGVLISTSGAGVKVENSFIYNIDGGGVIVDAPPATTLSNISVEVINTSIVNSCKSLSSSRAGDYGGIGTGGSGSRVYSNVQFDILNSIVQCKVGASVSSPGNGFLVHSSAVFTNTSSNNIANNGSVPGNNSYTNISFLDKPFKGLLPGNQVYFESLEPGFESLFLLDHPDNIAINRGTNISSLIPFDIQGEERLLVKKGSDIGADEAGSKTMATELRFDHDEVLEREIGYFANATTLAMSWKLAGGTNISNQTIYVYGSSDGNKNNGCDNTQVATQNVNLNNSYQTDISTNSYEWYFYRIETSFNDGTPTKTSACSRPQHVIATDIIRWYQNAASCPSGITSTNCVTDIASIAGEDLATLKKRLRVEIAGTWTSAWGTTIELNGWTTNSNYYLILKAVGNARHNGTINTSEDFIVTPSNVNKDGVSFGPYISSPSGNNEFMEIDGFVISGMTNNNQSYDVVGVWVQTSGNKIKNMIIANGFKSGSNSGTVNAIYAEDDNASALVENVISYNMPGNFLVVKNGTAWSGVTGVRFDINNVTAYNMCTQSSLSGDVSAIGYKNVTNGTGFSSSKITVSNSFLDCNLYSEFLLNSTGNQGSIEAKNVMISGSSTTGSTFTNGQLNVGINDLNTTSSVATNNIVFSDIVNSPIDLRLAFNANIKNDALGMGKNTGSRDLDIQSHLRDYSSDIGADEYTVASTFIFKESSSPISRYEFGELNADSTVTIELYNTGGVSVNNVTVTLVDNAGGSYSVDSNSCNNATIAAANSCSIKLAFNHSSGAIGLKRGTIELKGDGIISDSITIEAFKVLGTTGGQATQI